MCMCVFLTPLDCYNVVGYSVVDVVVVVVNKLLHQQQQQ